MRGQITDRLNNRPFFHRLMMHILPVGQA